MSFRVNSVDVLAIDR